MEDTALASLRKALGERALRLDPPLEIGGRRLCWMLRPESGETLATALRVLGEQRLAALLRGGGSHDGLGNLPRRADLVLSTGALSGVRELDLDEGVVWVGAGTPLETVAEALAGSGWELPLDAASAGSTVGGSLAAGSPGLRFPRPRDAVLGLDVVLASGERTRCGGRVVKNVTGYDLAKLYVGSLGSLGVIEAAWLRLRPAPERVTWWCAKLRRAGEGQRDGLALARRPAVRAALLEQAGPGREVQILVELAGDAAAVAADEVWLQERHDSAPSDGAAFRDAWAALRAAPAPGRLRFRLHGLPTRLAEASAVLAAVGARCPSAPHEGLCWGLFELPAESGAAALDAAFAAVREAAEKSSGGWLLECAPAWARRGREVFGESGATLALMRALKQQFDPTGILNPGRCAGGV